MASAQPLAKFSWILTLASAAVVIGALYLAKEFLVPFMLAVLLTFLLKPICNRLERWGMSRILAVLVSTVLAFAVLGTLGWIVVSQMTSLATKLPQYEQGIQKKLNSVNDRLGSAVRKLTKTAEADVSKSEKGAEPASPGERSYLVRVMSTPASPMHVLTGMFGTLLEVLGSTGIVIVLSVFFLVRREDLRDRFIRLVGKGDVTVTTQAIEDAVSRVTRYLSMQFLMNALFGISVGIGIYFIGLPAAFPLGNLSHDSEIRALRRHVDRCGGTDRPVDRDLNGLADSNLNHCTVRRTRAVSRQLPGALALWQEYRRVSRGGPGGGRVLDMALGNDRLAPLDSVDCVPIGNRPVRTPALLLERSAGR